MVIKVILDEPEGLRYFPGSGVKGTVVVNVDEPKDYTEVSVELVGGAHVHWSESHGSGDSRTYRNSVTYVKEKNLVWSKENSPSGELTVGEHVFPFQFTLPQNIPPSFKTVSGQVAYEITARLSQSVFLKTDYKANAVLDVKEDTSELLRSCMEPESAEKDGTVQSLCFNHGSISMKCSLPRTGFSPGDSIPISVHLVNQSTKRVRGIRVSLAGCDVFTSSDNRHRRLNGEVASLFSPPIQAGGTTQFDGKSLQIPREVATTLRSCSFISLEYFFVVKAIVSGGSNLLLQIPVVITGEGISQTSE